MKPGKKRSCCGGKIDINKFGRCPRCMTVAAACTLLFWSLYVWSSSIALGWPTYLFLGWALLFSLIALAHVAGFFQARSEQKAQG
jgi:hypothetical protein